MLLNWPHIQGNIATRAECYNYITALPFLKDFDVGSYEPLSTIVLQNQDGQKK